MDSKRVISKPNKLLGVRHLQCLLMFFGVLLAYAMRVHMSVAVVAMTTDGKNGTEKEFDWDSKKQSVILSSFFMGYIILQIPSGILAGKFGGKPLLATCVGVNGLVTIATPVFAPYGGWIVVCACRVLQGLTQGFLYPSVHCLLGRWVPKQEKSRLATFVYSGTQLGTALEMMAAGLISHAFGWRWIFYSVGGLGLVWTVVYICFGSSSPELSKIISTEERDYILCSLGRLDGEKKLKTPWRSIATSLPFFALILAHCGQNWGFFTLFTEMPTYMSKVLEVNLAANGLMSSLPYLTMFLLSFVFGYVSDYAIERKWVEVTTARKISNTIGLWGPAIVLIGLAYVPDQNVTLAVFCLVLAVGLNAGQFTGYLMVHIDMAPNFAGQLMGVTNFFANIVSLIAPLAAGMIVQDEKDAHEWRKVFFLSSAIYFVLNLFFIIFGSSKKQPWNTPKEEKDNCKMDDKCYQATNLSSMGCRSSDMPNIPRLPLPPLWPALALGAPTLAISVSLLSFSMPRF